ncbi:MAG: hypothetical protein M3N41_14160 [Acidobacteriota bacterium]|nr:hypothetical protein [Acidobacteriota bacterium]
MAVIPTMITANWLASIWNSTDSLSSVVTKANWGIAATLLCGCIFTAISIVAGNRKDDLLKTTDQEREERIAKSNETAESAKAVAAGANAEAEKSKTERAKLELRIQELTQDNIGQQKRIVDLEDDRKPRLISPQQEAAIVKALASTNSVGSTVEIRVYARENEANVYAARLSQVLAAAGLKPHTNLMLDQSGTGFGFAIHALNDAPPLANAIGGAFRSAGIEFAALQEPALVKEHEFFIFIGVKPSVVKSPSATQL